MAHDGVELHEWPLAFAIFAILNKTKQSKKKLLCENESSKQVDG